MSRLFALAAVSLAIGGCGSASRTSTAMPPAPPPGTAPAGGFSGSLEQGNDLFAGRLLALLRQSQPTVAFSPFSISNALAMTSAGARGQTASQIAAALDFGLPPTPLQAAFGALDHALAAVNGPDVTLTIANALYAQRGMAFRQAFLALLARSYGTGLRTADFAGAAAAARSSINAWVSQVTHGRITNLLSAADVNDLTRLVLVNAVYLHAKWVSPFRQSDTSAAPFHALGGVVRVPTMHQTSTFAYRRGSGFGALELPYLGGRLALDLLLPDPGRLASLQSSLAGGALASVLHGLRPARVELSLPKLLLQTRIELAQALSSLGMPLAFTSGADLSGIAGRPGDLSLHTVVHAAYLHVDEAGTEAAAATGVGVTATALAALPTIVFDVNRPFVFVLRDRRTGAVLFVGAVSRP